MDGPVEPERRAAAWRGVARRGGERCGLEWRGEAGQGARAMRHADDDCGRARDTYTSVLAWC